MRNPFNAIYETAAMYRLMPALQMAIASERGPYVPKPGAGHHRAQDRLQRQRAVWADTPISERPESRQVRRQLARRAA